jgi:dUTP pyrophosphatase
MDQIRIARLDPKAILPTRKHPGDAGLDLYSLCAARVEPNQVAILRTGVTVSIPQGLVGLLMAKSRSDHLLGAGVVDAGYQGEILIKVVNALDRALEFAAGQAIAQMLLVPVLTPAVEECDPAEIHAEASARGGSGGIVDQHQSDPVGAQG